MTTKLQCGPNSRAFHGWYRHHIDFNIFLSDELKPEKIRYREHNAGLVIIMYDKCYWTIEQDQNALMKNRDFACTHSAGKRTFEYEKIAFFPF